MVAYSCFRRRTIKWWQKVFFHLFSLAILNAYILYKETTRSPVLHRAFRRELVKELIRSSGISPSLTPRGRPRRSAEGLTRLVTWKSFSREDTGHWEVDQHHTILCSLFSWRNEDFGKDRREEEEARKRVQLSVLYLQGGLMHLRLLSIVPHCSGLCCCLCSCT